MRLLRLLLPVFFIVELALMVQYSISDEISPESTPVLIRPIAPIEPLKPIGNYSSKDEEQYKKAVIQYEKARALFSKMKKQQKELERSCSDSNAQVNQSEK
ncbi:MAG: hypothetical protein D3911_13220 [Candidatus Electrothrix sp. AW3_4]|nr:hypothetical protein [Candidatus Electrothrix gigas]